MTILQLDRKETETIEKKETYEIRRVMPSFLTQAYNNTGTPHTPHIVVLQQ